MRDVLLYAALGLGAGALIASVALGVVLIYRGSGIINLATGAIAMLAAYLYWAFKTGYFHFYLRRCRPSRSRSSAWPCSAS